MMNETVSALLNAQINAEFYSAYLYLNISSFFQARGLDGFAHWYEVQAQEERDHAMLFYRYLHNNGQAVRLETVNKPEDAMAAPMEALQVGLAHEVQVTGLIDLICEAAHTAKDFRTIQFLDWFVKEQGEEEKNAADLVQKMELFGGDPKSLYMLNGELAARVYAPPGLVL